MSYKGSYIWKIRQKVGRQLLITVTVAVVPINENNEVKLVYADHLGKWTLVGGHVEEGDSYASAAINELQEEAGIVAAAKDLVPFATISGSGRIYHYEDGDTQPFTLAFFVKKWQSESKPTDEEEISSIKWMPLEKALVAEETRSVHKLLAAYQEFCKSGRLQMIEVEK